MFTDIECSTELVKRLEERYGEVLAAHYDLLRGVFATHGVHRSLAAIATAARAL